MSEVRLPADARTEFGKGGARRTRRAGKIPAVIYGHGQEPRHVSLPAREFTNAIRHGGANVLLTIEVDGDEQLAIPKAIQRHAIKGHYEHVDLLAVRRGEKVTVVVPLSVVGALVAGGMLAQENNTVSVEADATSLPSEIEVSITGLQIGSHVTAGDLDLPPGVTLITEAETIMLLIQASPTEADMSELAEGAEVESAASEAPAAESAE